MIETPVEVLAVISLDRQITPVALLWNDKKYKIHQIISKRALISEEGKKRIKYVCRFGKTSRNLYLEDERWLLESEIMNY